MKWSVKSNTVIFIWSQTFLCEMTTKFIWCCHLSSLLKWILKFNDIWHSCNVLFIYENSFAGWKIMACYISREILKKFLVKPIKHKFLIETFNYNRQYPWFLQLIVCVLPIFCWDTIICCDIGHVKFVVLLSKQLYVTVDWYMSSGRLLSFTEIDNNTQLCIKYSHTFVNTSDRHNLGCKIVFLDNLLFCYHSYSSPFLTNLLILWWKF